MSEEKSHFNYKPVSIGILAVLMVLWATTMAVTQKELFPWWLFILFWIIELFIGTFVAITVLTAAKKI